MPQRKPMIVLGFKGLRPLAAECCLCQEEVYGILLNDRDAVDG